MPINGSLAREHVKMPHAVIVRSPGLLPMMYRTQELASELGVRRKDIVRWARSGAPHQRDKKGHIWIHGRLFASWVESHRRSRSRRRLPPGKGYCLRCRRVTTIQDPERIPVGSMVRIEGTCEACGAKVRRGAKR